MPIINLQRRQTEVGRIRLGNSVDTGRKNKAGQPIRRPVKLEQFRFTSPSKTLIEQVAALYGGTPTEWQPQGGGAKQWEVYSEAQAIPVVVPPNSVSQWYESWNGGMCMRRCDGERELISDKPCLCSPEPTERECKPTTRISLMLAEAPGIGVWRLESHGFYAATELPAVAELLAAAGGYVPARLEIEERTAKREKQDGGVETRRWLVPVLHVDAAPAELLALTSGDRQAVGAGEERRAIGAAPAGDDEDGEKLTAQRVLELARYAKNVEQVQELWRSANRAGVLTDQVKAALEKRAADLKPAQAQPPAEPAVEGEVEPDVEQTWMGIVAQAGEYGWSTDDLERRFCAIIGKPTDEANGFELAKFLGQMKTGEAFLAEVGGAR